MRKPSSFKNALRAEQNTPAAAWEGPTVTAFLVMGGQVPEKIFSSMEKAQLFIADRVEAGGLPPSYFRIFRFELDK